MNRPSSPSTSQPTRWGRLRQVLNNYLVPMLIWGGIGVGGGFLAIKIVERSLAPAPSSNPEIRWPNLPSVLRGKQIEVPSGAGFWVSRDPQAEVLIHRANVSGQKREINLCQQLKNPPNELYPMTLAGAWVDVLAAKKSGKFPVQRSPLVVAPEVAAAMPRLVIRGKYRGLLSAEVTPGPQTGRWELAFAETSGKSFVLGDESWLLWQPKLAPEGKGRFSHAIRIRRLPDQAIADNPHCREATEKLEWQLYTALPASGAKPQLSEKADVVIRAAGANSAVHLQLSTGEHLVPVQRAPQMEDKVLFDRAYARGLIRERADGLAEWVPGDLARAGVDSIRGWTNVKLADPETKALHKALYRSANGDFVRDQLKHFNANQKWLGVRVRVASNSQAWSDLRRWQAQAENQALSFSNNLPDVSVRMFDGLPLGWSAWVRIANWPLAVADGAAPTVSMSVTPPEGSKPGQQIELLALGQLVSVSGGRVLSSKSMCLVAACPAADLLTLASIELGGGQLVLNLKADTRFNHFCPEASDGSRVQLRQGKLAWVDEAGGGRFGSHVPLSEVTLRARDGTPLFAEGQTTETATAIGVVEMVGLGVQHKSGVVGILGRLNEHNYSHAVVTLSIDTQLQELADKVLDCVGLRLGEWDAVTRQCAIGDNTAPIPERRIASLVILDAENGDILAAAGGPHAPANVKPADLIAFDRFNPGASRLRVQAWQHDGGKRYSPGSTFKLVDALALEHWAAAQPERQAQLAGLTLTRWDAEGKEMGFATQAGCYPHPCNQHWISNFQGKPASNASRNERLGLAEALEKSVNTWFAWMVERSDATAHLAPETPALGSGGLEEARPVLAMAHRLGFEQKQRLDGGLLPKDFAWQADDHLQTVASRFDSIVDVHNIRLQAIGQRMQVTPLQMAEVAAGIATGKTVSPRLLLDLNGVSAINAAGNDLDVELSRVRRGMKAVVDSGTAASAFSSGRVALLRHLVFGKTGTANMENHAGEKKAGVKGDSNQVVWFVGYLQAGSLPDQPHALAFAVSISHSSLTGGGHAAKVMAALLGSMVPATWT